MDTTAIKEKLADEIIVLFCGQDEDHAGVQWSQKGQVWLITLG